MFAEKLKNARMSKGLTQKAVAEYIEILPKAYQKYEYGIREPSLDILVKLCRLLEITSDYLLGLSENPKPNK